MNKSDTRETLAFAAFYLFVCFSLIKDHRLGLKITTISSALVFYSNRSPFHVSICSCSISFHFSFSFLCQTLSTVCKIFETTNFSASLLSTTIFASFFHFDSYKVSIFELLWQFAHYFLSQNVFFFIFEPMSLWSSFQTRFEMFKWPKVVKFSNRNRFLRYFPWYVTLHFQKNVPRMVRFIRCIFVLSNVLEETEASARYFEFASVLTLSLWVFRPNSVSFRRKFTNNVEICWAWIWSIHWFEVRV